MANLYTKKGKRTPWSSGPAMASFPGKVSVNKVGVVQNHVNMYPHMQEPFHWKAMIHGYQNQKESNCCVFLEEYDKVQDADEAPPEWHGKNCKKWEAYFAQASDMTFEQSIESHKKYGCSWSVIFARDY